MTRPILAALAASLLIACGGGNETMSQQSTAGSETPAASQAAAPDPAPARQQPQTADAQPRAAAEQQPAQAPRATAPGSAARFEAGTHYQRLSPPQPTSSEDDEIEVAEVFMYSCPACLAFEPHVSEWKERKADYVNLVHIPAMFNQLARVHAQGYYTAEALGKLDEMHTPFFTEIHVNDNLLDSEAAMRRFFARFGVSGEEFANTWDSFAVHTRMQRADELVRRYRVTGTPTVVVQGKYVTTGSMAGSYQTWFDVIDALAAEEYAAISEN